MSSKKYGTLHCFAVVLAVIGGINWGLVGLFDFNLVSFLFGHGMVTKFVYIVIGICAMWVLYGFMKCCKEGK